MLKWDETELIDFFSSLCEFEETSHSHTFSHEKNGLRVVVTLFEFEGTVYSSIFRENSDESLITIRRDLCSHVQVTMDVAFKRCFEAGSPEYPVTNMGIAPKLSRGVRIYLEPDIKIVLIESRYEFE